MRRVGAQSLAVAPEIGMIVDGLLVGSREFGYIVSLGPWRALWHISDIRRVGDAAALASVGRTARFKVVKSEPTGQRISVSLVAWVDDMSKVLNKDRGTSAREEVGGGLIGDQRTYGVRIATALDEGVAAINELGFQKRNLKPAQRAGYVNEQVHTSEFNVDASFKGARLRATRLNSNAAKSADIVVEDGSGIRLNASAKVHFNAKKSAGEQRGYGDQARLVPADQLEGVRTHARKQAAKEAAKGPHRSGPAREHAEVRDLATDRISTDRVSSRPQTRQQARAMGEKARAKQVSSSDIAGEMSARARDGARRGAQSGAIIGAAIETASAAVEAVSLVRSGESTVAQAAMTVGVRAVKGAAEGGAKGAVSGSVTAAAQVIATRTSSAAMKGLLRSNAPAAVAIVACDVAYSAIKLSTGVIDRQAFAAEASRAVQSGAAGYVGAALGGALGGPAGAFIGGIAGNLVAAQAAQHGVWDRLARMLEDSTATGHSASALYHFEEVNRVAELLRNTGAVAVFDRVFKGTRGGHVSVGAVIVVGSRVLAVDVRAWRGQMCFGDAVEERAVESDWPFPLPPKLVTTPDSDVRRVVQTKTLPTGAQVSKEHPNPAVRLGAGTRSMHRWLTARDSRWRRVPIMPLVLFSAEDASYSDAMQTNGAFATLAELRAMLDDCPRADPWLCDDLATSPTWDAVTDRNGNVYQGLLSQSHVLVTLEGRQVEVPWISIFKLGVRAGGALSRSDLVEIRLRNGECVRGQIGRETLKLSRMGHSHELRFADVVQVCPASTYFSLDLAGAV